MTSRITTMFAAAALSLLTTGALTPARAALTVKLATIAPEGSYWMQTMQRGAEEITRRTEGRVKLKFYTGGVMGNDKSVLRKIRVGQLDGGAFTMGGLAAVNPDLLLYGLPLFYPSTEVVDRVRAVLDPLLVAGLEREGFICFGFAEGGFARFMSREPVDSIASMKGRKMWVPEGDPVSYAGMEMLGLSPVTLPITDVLTGLQSGLVEIVATSSIGAIAFQWHTKVHYITETPVAYVAAALAVKKETFQKMSAEDQAVFREVMVGIYKEMDKQNREDDKAAYEALLAQGVKPVTPKAAEVAVWRRLGRQVADKLAADKTFSRELYEKILEVLGPDAASAN